MSSGIAIIITSTAATKLTGQLLGFWKTTFLLFFYENKRWIVSFNLIAWMTSTLETKSTKYCPITTSVKAGLTRILAGPPHGLRSTLFSPRQRVNPTSCHEIRPDRLTSVPNPPAVHHWVPLTHPFRFHTGDAWLLIDHTMTTPQSYTILSVPYEHIRPY